MPPIIIAAVQSKGGSGKSATAVQMACALALHGFRTGLVDLDSQGHAGRWFSFGRPDNRIAPSHPDSERTGILTPNMTDVFLGTATIEDVMRPVVHKDTADRLHVAPSSFDLYRAETALVVRAFSACLECGTERRSERRCDCAKPENLPLGDLAAGDTRHVLAGKLESLPYDYIVLDTSPTWGLILENALVAAHHLIIPVALDPLHFDGLKHLLDRMDKLSEWLGEDLLRAKLAFVVPTFKVKGESKTVDLLLELENIFPENLIHAGIRKNISLSYAVGRGSVFELFPNSNAAEDYQRLANDFLERHHA